MKKKEINPFNAVVKLEVSSSETNPIFPWKSSEGASSGTGVVITDDGVILTCAHCVSCSTFIRIRKQNEDSIYKAEVLFINEDCDLALIHVADKKFMNDIVPMDIGETPEEQTQVVAVGYPMGGEGLSFTRGIVSRIEDQVYTFSHRSLLAIQIDAAINPGNSGGPIIDARTTSIVGIAFQGAPDGQNLGYAVPTEIIYHFLKDVEDGKVDGFSHWFFHSSTLENEDARAYYGMKKGMTGVLVSHVDSAMEEDSLKLNDVLLEIDGYKIANNGFIRTEGNRKHEYGYPVYMRQIGEKVPVKVLRNKKIVKTHITARRSKTRVRDEVGKFDYYLFGGLVFSTLTMSIFSNISCNNKDIIKQRAFPDDEAVVLTSVLADDCVEGYFGAGGFIVKAVNGTEVRNLVHLIELIESCKDKYIHFTTDTGSEWDEILTFGTEKLRSATQRIMETYLIPADRSPNLPGAPEEETKAGFSRWLKH